jgi:hypothetical protein
MLTITEGRMPDDGRRTPEERVDAAIDLVVREMLDVEPRADLRARVIEQIERPRRAFNWTWVMVPVAAAAVLVLAVVLLQPGKPIVTRAATSIVVRPIDTRPAATIARRQESRNAPPMRTVRPHERRIAAALTPADETNFSAEPPAGFAVVDALRPPPPIVVEQIPSAAPPAVASLDIAPLQLPALEMNALADSPRERREE